MEVLKTYTHVAACSPAPSLPAKGCNSPPCLSGALEERPSPFPGCSRRGVTWLWARQALTSHSAKDSFHYLHRSDPSWGFTSVLCCHTRLWTPQVTLSRSKCIRKLQQHRQTPRWRKTYLEIPMANSLLQLIVALQYHISAYRNHNTHTHIREGQRGWGPVSKVNRIKRVSCPQCWWSGFLKHTTHTPSGCKLLRVRVRQICIAVRLLTLRQLPPHWLSRL